MPWNRVLAFIIVSIVFIIIHDDIKNIKADFEAIYTSLINRLNVFFRKQCKLCLRGSPTENFETFNLQYLLVFCLSHTSPNIND